MANATGAVKKQLAAYKVFRQCDGYRSLSAGRELFNALLPEKSSQRNEFSQYIST